MKELYNRIIGKNLSIIGKGLIMPSGLMAATLSSQPPTEKGCHLNLTKDELEGSKG